MTQMTSENDKELKKVQSGAETEDAGAGDSELNEPRWSVVSFESIAAHDLTYAEARNQLEELQKQDISGLCIVTAEAAARMTGQKE